MVNQEAAMYGDETVGGDGIGTAPAQKTSSYDKPEISDERKALVEKWCKRIKAAKTHNATAKAFDRMRKSMKIAAHGTAEILDDDSYIVPVINRYVNSAVAALYARNPTAIARRKQKLMFQIWDGDPATLQAAMVAAQPQPAVDPMTGQPAIDPMTGAPAAMPGDPNAMALLQEVQAAKQDILMQDRMAKTLGLLFKYYFAEQDCGYKEQFKALVRRVKVCGVGYVKLGFQRILKKNPDAEAAIADATSQIARLEALTQEKLDGEIDDGDARLEELRLLIQDLQTQLQIIAREGPVLSFPKSTEIIVDTRCRHLKTFAGAWWIAHEFDMDPEDAKETYGCDLATGGYVEYNEDGKAAAASDGNKTGKCRIWEVQDKKNQQVFTICDGYCDFLKEPAEPDVKIERFWTVFPLVFNEIESEDEIYPPSDVWNARHMQRDYNSKRQGEREHRIAARPRPVASKGRLEENEKKSFGTQAAFELVELNSLAAGERVNDLIQWMQVPGVDPNLYQVETTFADIQRTVGAQAADFGGTSGDTATEASIAEQGRATTNSSDVDDLDTLLTQLVRAMGQLLLLEVTKDTVVEICGPGAVWPDAPPSREQIAKDLYMEIEAGSSGRPNRAAELANFERAMPYLSLIPGIKPEPIAKKALPLLDIDPEEAIVEGLPSIAAMNQMAGRNMQAGAGPDDPNQQGDKGRQNAEDPQKNEQQSQPAYPAPGPVTH